MEVFEDLGGYPPHLAWASVTDRYETFGNLFSQVSDSLDYLESHLNQGNNPPILPQIEGCREQGDIVALGPKDALGVHQAFEIRGHQLAMEVLRDGDRFSSSVYNSIVGSSIGETMLMMDGEGHSRLRASLRNVFKGAAVDRYKDTLFRPLAHSLISAFPGDAPFDLIQAFAYEFPARCLTQVIGVPEEDESWVQNKSIELLSVAINRDLGIKARHAVGGYFRPLINRDPSDNRGCLRTLSHLCQVGQLQEEEALSFIRLLLVAGTETSFRSLSNLLVILLTQQGLMTRLRRDPGLINKAVAESLRWEPASFDIHRVATRNTSLRGLFIPKGARIAINRLRVNRDEAIFQDPHTFNLDRPHRLNLAFSAGAHHCIGLGIAHAEMQVALEVILERCPNLRLDPEQPPPTIEGHQFRRPKSIPVLM